MEAQSLVQLHKWVQENVTANKVLKLLTALDNAITENTNPNNPRREFQGELESFRSATQRIRVSDLTAQQIGLLKEIGIFDLLGSPGAQAIVELVNLTPGDIASTSNRIKEARQQLQRGLEKLSQIGSILEPLFPIRTSTEEEYIFGVQFQADVSINNVVDLKQRAIDWHDIGRSLSLATGTAPEDVRVVGVSNGSIIVKLALCLISAKLLAAIYAQVISAAERTLEIAKKYQEVRALSLQNKAAENALNAAIKEEKESQPQKIVDQVLSEMHDSIPQPVDGERRNALEFAVRRLLTFVAKGGGIEFRPLESDDPSKAENEFQNLKVALNKLKDIPNDVKLIVFASDESDDSDDN